MVFRDTGYGGLYDQGWDLKLDGAPLKALKTGTYVYADRPVGRHQLSATMDMFMGVSRTDFTADAGRTYFFMAKPSDRANAMTAMTRAGGLAGMVVAAAEGSARWWRQSDGTATVSVTHCGRTSWCGPAGISTSSNFR